MITVFERVNEWERRKEPLQLWVERLRNLLDLFLNCWLRSLYSIPLQSGKRKETDWSKTRFLILLTEESKFMGRCLFEEPELEPEPIWPSFTLSKAGWLPPPSLSAPVQLGLVASLRSITCPFFHSVSLSLNSITFITVNKDSRKE